MCCVGQVNTTYLYAAVANSRLIMYTRPNFYSSCEEEYNHVL